MNNDLISRSELKKTLCEFMKNNIGIYSNEMFHLVDSIPAVNTVNIEKQSFIEGFKEGCEHGKKCYERPQGVWESEEIEIFMDNWQVVFTCNQCNKQFYKTFNFCPNCGADMRGTKDE